VSRPFLRRAGDQIADGLSLTTLRCRAVRIKAEDEVAWNIPSPGYYHKHTSTQEAQSDGCISRNRYVNTTDSTSSYVSTSQGEVEQAKPPP
jgi:hypothetical protein